ncbi:MAG: hypothetical protein V1773_00155 [bacterium]
MKDLKLIYSRNPIFRKCPECKAPNVLHRSRARSMFEQAIKRFTFFNIYRCKNCGWRGYLSSLTITKVSLKNLGIYLILMSIAFLIISFVLSKFLIK